MKRLYILFGLFTIPLFLFTIPSLINISFFQGLQSDFSNLIIEATVANQTVPVQYEIVQVQPSEWALANVSVPDGNYALFFLASQQNAPPPEQQNPQNAQSPAANHTPSGQNILQDQSASPLPPPGQQLPNGTFNESEQNGTLITFYYDLVENQTQSQQSESFLSQNETQPDVAFLQLGNLTQNGTQPPNNTQNESEPALNLTQENQTVIFTFNFTIGNESTENISFNITENGTDITELYYNLTNETLPSSKPYALNVSYFSSLEPDFSNLVVEYSSQNGSAQNMSYEILELQTSEWALISLERAPFENETVQLLAASKETNEEKDNGKKRNFEIISSTASRSLLSFPNGKTLTVENDLLSLLNATPTVRVIVSSPSPLSGSIMSLQGGLQVLEIGIGDLQNLTQGGATEIYLDRQMGISLQDTIPLIGASRAQAELNASGDGVAICLLDTGVDFSLPSLSGKAVSGFDFVNNDTNASDDNGHGTFMASVIHAVAPNATMLAVKVLDASGTGYSSNIMAGIDYCKQLAAGGQIKIISMSFGGGNYTEYCGADLVAQAAEGAVSSGLLAVASTGNNGANYITAPACAQSVTAVSSTSKSDTVSPFSNMNGMVDLLAPGENVQIPGTGGTYIKSGTSVSAAHVSGAAALLLQSNSSMTPAEMQYRFQTTGAIIPFNNSNFTRINVYNAILNNITSLPSNQTINETNQTGNYTYNASITSIGGCDIAACGYPGCQINTRGETYSIDRSLTTSGGGSETCLTVNAPSAIIVGNANIITATTLGDIGIAVAAPSADISGVKFDAETAILVNSDSANIHDNTIRDTAANIYGINWQSGNGGTISGNTISSTATGYIGIYFQSGSSSTVTGNKINGEKAIRADNPFSSNTLLNHNNLTGTTWIDDQGSSNPWDDGTAGNEYHFSNNTGAWKTYNIYDTNGDGWADAGSDLPFTSTNVAQMLGNAVDNHPYAGASVSSCQDITTPGIYSLNQSFGGPGTCIYIGASNVALHGMGYTLSGTIKTEKASGVAISNLTIDPGYGLIVSATNSSSFSNISITNVSLIGIWATNSSNRNNFTNIAINSSGATGIQVDTSSANNSFIGIYINESGSSHGIYSAGGSGNYFNCASGYITGRGNSTLCLQDQANVSTMCNGISAGTYACTGVWDATQVCALAADGDWSTMGVRAAPKNAFIWMNYTKPSGATSSSVWMAQLGANAATNYTIPSGCFGQQPLQFQVSSYNNGSAEGACYDGSAWVIIASTASSNRVFEEAMYWSSQPYGIYSNQTNTSVLGCNVAAFYTGINYNGANGTIMNSAVHDNWNNGLAFSGSNGNTIGNLSAYLNNGSGFDFAGSSSNAIGNITSYSNGIYGLLLNSVSENNSIVNLTAYKNTLYGVYVSSSNYNNITSSLAYNNSEGFNWYGSSYCQISSSTSRDNSQYGFRVQSQQYNNFTGNTAYNNSNDGFYVYRSLSGSDDFNTISSSTSYNNTGNGFRMGTNSNAINFTNNTAYNNRLSGFNFTSVDKALITNSTSYANLEEGARLQITNSNVTGNNISSNYSTALNITATSTSIFANNTLNGTGFTLVLSTPTTSNNFTNNTLLMSSSGVTLASVLLYIPAKTSNGNTFWHNNFTDTSALYITDAAVAGAPNYYNISNVTVALGNIYANVISGTVPIAGTYPAPFPSGGASAFYYGSAGSGYPYSDTTSVGKTTGMTADNGPITPLSSASCLNLTTNYTLVQNVISTGGTCFSINANNITLNCSGYSITGANASDNIAVFSNRNYSMLRDCYITNFSEDLRINNGVGAIIFNNTLLTTFAGGNATHLMNGTNITNMTLNRMSVGLGNATVIETISLNNTVDCQGGSINGSNYSATYGIYTSQTNTTVKNCQISNLATGIFFNGVENGTINNTNAS
ncbi:MAG: S8 family serine peptidase, partial [Candidatus Micrarchaeota archaeon]|nr:S8 family serine peptidase [Candidatus Micrarchaeota archaeon]